MIYIPWSSNFACYPENLFVAWMSYFWIKCQCYVTFVSMVNIGHIDLYFMVHWFCLLFWLFDGWTYFGIILWQWPIFHSPLTLPHILKCISWMNVKLRDNESLWWSDWPTKECRSMPFMVQWFCFLSWSVSWMNIILRDHNESMWCNDWPFNKCRSHWPMTYIIFHGPLILHWSSVIFAFLFFMHAYIYIYFFFCKASYTVLR